LARVTIDAVGDAAKNHVRNLLFLQKRHDAVEGFY